jgi:hypothetical protein
MAAIGAASICSSISAAPGVTYHVLALSGGTAPATGGAMYDFELGGPWVLDDGTAVFRSKLRGPGVDSTSDYALFAADAGATRLVAREGQAAPGLPGLTFGNVQLSGSGFNSLSQPDSRGGPFFRTDLSGSGLHDDNRIAYYFRTVDEAGLLARWGDAAPGLPGNVPWRPTEFGIDADGIMVVNADLNPAGQAPSTGVWVGTPGNFQPLLVRGTPAPGMTAGTIYNAWATTTPSGQMLVSATLDGAPPGTHIFTGTRGDLRLLIKEGDPAPGVSGGVLEQVSLQAMSSTGAAAVVGLLEGEQDPRDDALFYGTPGNLKLVARAGDPAPGTDRRFSGELDTHYDFIPDFASGLQVNDRGSIAFGARLAGPSEGSDSGTFVDEWGIWAGDADDLKLIARSGQRAPGTEPGVVFGWKPNPSAEGEDYPFLGFVLNDSGRVAFGSRLLGGLEEDVGIFLSDLDGNAQLLARVGDVLTIGGVERTIAALGLTSLNDVGQAGLFARFADGTTASIVASVPEPGASAAAVLALGALARRRRHAR